MATRSKSNRTARSNRARYSDASIHAKSFLSDPGVPLLEEDITFGIPPCEVSPTQAFSKENLYLHGRFTRHLDALTAERIALRMEMKTLVMILYWTDPSKLKGYMGCAKIKYTDEELRKFHPDLRPGMGYEEVCDMLLLQIAKHGYVVGMCEGLKEVETWQVLVSILRAATIREYSEQRGEMSVMDEVNLDSELFMRADVRNEAYPSSLPLTAGGSDEVERRQLWENEAQQSRASMATTARRFEPGFRHEEPPNYLAELEAKWPGGVAANLDNNQRAPALEPVREGYVVYDYERHSLQAYQQIEPRDVKKSKKPAVGLPRWSELRPKLRKSIPGT